MNPCFMRPMALAWLLTLAFGIAPALSDSSAWAGERRPLSSPDGRIKVLIQMPTPGSGEKPTWSATFRGKPFLDGCRLGLETAEGGELMAGARIVGERRRTVDQRIPVLFGK